MSIVVSHMTSRAAGRAIHHYFGPRCAAHSHADADAASTHVGPEVKKAKHRFPKPDPKRGTESDGHMPLGCAAAEEEGNGCDGGAFSDEHWHFDSRELFERLLPSHNSRKQP